MGRDFVPVEESFLCSKHFRADLIIKNLGPCRQVQLGGIPSIFEHNVSPDKPALKRKLNYVNCDLEKSKKQILALKQKVIRRNKRIANLSDIIDALRKDTTISDDCVDVLEYCCGGVKDLIKRQEKKLTGKIKEFSI